MLLLSCLALLQQMCSHQIHVTDVLEELPVQVLVSTVPTSEDAAHLSDWSRHNLDTLVCCTISSIVACLILRPGCALLHHEVGGMAFDLSEGDGCDRLRLCKAMIEPPKVTVAL